MKKTRPGDFSQVWPLLSERARVLASDLIRSIAVADTARLRVQLHDVVRAAPNLAPRQRKDLAAMLALLEDRS